MTPDHKFELLRTVASVIPATVLSVWAFIHQRRQTLPRLEVLISPIRWATIDGKSVLGEDWPGLVVRNQSTFPLRVFNVGFRIGRKFYSFGRPAVGGDSALTPAKQWPLELAPRSRTAFYLDGVPVSFGDSIKPALKGRRIWEVARAYAMTECNHTFVSRKLSRKALATLRQAEPKLPVA